MPIRNEKLAVAKNVILVSSGKGGVGKSTIAAILSQNLAGLGYQTGLLDADLYGPSIPTIFALNTYPKIIDGKIQPIKAHGVQVMSMGLLVPDQVLAWRGPMATKAIYQLFSKVMWLDLDYLIVDLPPGTGDIHLSILENYHIKGVVLVTTASLLSAKDVAKAIDLYQKFNTHIYGIIENMHTQEALNLHGSKELAANYNLEIITQLPLLTQLTVACDSGANLNDIVTLPLTWLIDPQ